MQCSSQIQKKKNQWKYMTNVLSHATIGKHTIASSKSKRIKISSVSFRGKNKLKRKKSIIINMTSNSTVHKNGQHFTYTEKMLFSCNLHVPPIPFCLTLSKGHLCKPTQYDMKQKKLKCTWSEITTRVLCCLYHLYFIFSRLPFLREEDSFF